MFAESESGFSSGRYHNWWAYRYFVCEFLSLVNVIGKSFELYLVNVPNAKYDFIKL